MLDFIRLAPLEQKCVGGSNDGTQLSPFIPSPITVLIRFSVVASIISGFALLHLQSIGVRPASHSCAEFVLTWSLVGALLVGRLNLVRKCTSFFSLASYPHTCDADDETLRLHQLPRIYPADEPTI